METAGVKIDTYRMGEITARLAERVEELESQAFERAGEEFMLGSTQQVGRVLFEQLGLTAGRKGKTGYSTDAKVLRSIRARARDRAGDRGVARALEAPQHVPRAAAVADLRGGRPPAHDVQPDGRRRRAASRRPSPNLQSIPIRTELGREIRSAFVAEEGHRIALGRLLADRAAHPGARLGRAEAAGGVRARRGHPHARRPRRCSASIPRS